jgi:Na+-translocating ferredoxin:NAD+ oxidoreductase RnfG subunit
MEKIKVIHDAVGHTLTVWLGDPANEHISEETTEEVVVMKDASGRVIGFEVLHYHPSETPELGLAVETVIRSEA